MTDHSFNPGDDEQPSTPPSDEIPSEVVFAARPTAVMAPPVIRPILYPESSMSRGSGAVDIFITVSLFLCAFASPQFIEVLKYLATRFPQFGILWSNVVIGMVTIAIVSLILICRRQGPATIGLGRFRRSTLVGAVIAGPGCFLMMVGTGVFYMIVVQLFSTNGVDAVMRDKESLMGVIPPFSLTTMLLFGVLTGFHEELLFRGLLLSRFNAILKNRWLAIGVCAILFGLMHSYQGPMGVLQTAAIGLVLGTIATMTRSLWPAIIGHAMFNSIQLAVLPIAKHALDAAQHQLTTMPIR